MRIEPFAHRSHSRVSGNPVRRASARQKDSSTLSRGYWIPAFAGMTLWVIAILFNFDFAYAESAKIISGEELTLDDGRIVKLEGDQDPARRCGAREIAKPHEWRSRARKYFDRSLWPHCGRCLCRQAMGSRRDTTRRTGVCLSTGWR